MCFNIVDILHVSAHFSIIINNISNFSEFLTRIYYHGSCFSLTFFYFARIKIIYIKINFNSDIQNIQDECHIYKVIICINYILILHYHQHINKFGVKKYDKFSKKSIIILDKNKNVLNWSKVTVKTFKLLQFVFALLNFVRPYHKRLGFHKKVLVTLYNAVFNINNNKKCFLNSKTAYWNDFWRIMWHRSLELLKIQLCITGIKCFLKYIK